LRRTIWLARWRERSDFKELRIFIGLAPAMVNWPGYAQRFVGPAYALFRHGDQAETPATLIKTAH
jgi:hypothetical protein